LSIKELAVVSRQRTVSHFLFSPAKFDQKQHDCRLHPPYFSVSPIEGKTERHFDTIEVMKAESQAVLNTLTEHDFRMHFNMAEALETVHTLGRGYFKGSGGQ
jgi:hypothetical protein